LPSFLTFYPTSYDYTLYTADPTDKGIYDIKMDVYFGGKVVGTTTFIVNVTTDGWNYDAPYFKKALKDQTVAVGSVLTYILPDKNDGDGDYVVVVAYTKSSSGAILSLPYYISNNDGTRFTFSPLYTSDVGSIVIYVDLHDDNHEPASFTEGYSFTLTVTPFVIKSTKSSSSSQTEADPSIQNNST
jgi:hypothetical protein